MMVLILIVCVAAVYIFIRTYKSEMQAKTEREQAAAEQVERVTEEQDVAS